MIHFHKKSVILIPILDTIFYCTVEANSYFCMYFPIRYYYLTLTSLPSLLFLLRNVVDEEACPWVAWVAVAATAAKVVLRQGP
jgi:hypothetical protein